MRVLARSQFAPLLSGPPRPTPEVRLRFDLGRPRASPPMIVPVVNPPATLHSASSFRAGALVVAIALAANAWMFMLQFQLESYETIADSGWMLRFEPPHPDAPVGGELRARFYGYRPAFG